MTDSERVSETERQKDKTLRIDERSKDKDIRVKERQKDVDTRQAEVDSTEKYNYEILRKNQRSFSKTIKLFAIVTIITFISIASVLFTTNRLKSELKTDQTTIGNLKNAINNLQGAITSETNEINTNHLTGLQNHTILVQDQKILCKLYLENYSKNSVCK